MQYAKPLIVATQAVLCSIALLSPAAAETFEFAAEVDSCLAAVNDRVGSEDAHRVRHLVTHSKRTGIGYALNIETSVFSADDEKRYAIYCLARDHSEPLKLEIEDLDG